MNYEIGDCPRCKAKHVKIFGEVPACLNCHGSDLGKYFQNLEGTLKWSTRYTRVLREQLKALKKDISKMSRGSKRRHDSIRKWQDLFYKIARAEITGLNSELVVDDLIKDAFAAEYLQMYSLWGKTKRRAKSKKEKESE